MSWLWWRDADGAKEGPVSQEWGLPVTIYLGEPSGESEAVGLGTPMPTRDWNSQPTNGKPLPQVSVSTTVVTQIAPYNARRRQIKITNVTGTQVVWIGNDGSVTATNGDFLAATIGSNNVYDSRQAIWGLSATAAQTVAVWESEYVVG